ncbi:hypothetical protein [Desulfolutivibrio sulfoxidireducens]|uniref:hypothetical protein n=1 Tax=Desulfolutivibrio sulfoxidireducens TaxID=2773299 RepID=UPI00159DC86F|nr:hypothetical protein [Desulfolutivibrio sulfoxidireducens]QLA15066.1 hypothetical protein GD605_02340 [Desulfolutivibrio sulfoxidireducens]
MVESYKIEEYKSLRTEMIALFERAFNFWKWGFVTLISIAGLTLLALGKAHIVDDNSILDQLIKQYSFWVGFGLFFFSVVFIWIITKTIYNLEDSSLRVGCYLSVFYESNNSLTEYKNTIGWHTWNRLQKKFGENPPKIDCDKDPASLIKNKQILLSQKFLYLYFIILAEFMFLLFMALLVISKPTSCLLLFISIIILIILYRYFKKIEVSSTGQIVHWNKEWLKLLSSPDDVIEGYLRYISLKK